MDKEIFYKKQRRQNKDIEWKRDIESYERYRRLLTIATTDTAKNFAMTQIERIRNKWPNHIK